MTRFRHALAATGAPRGFALSCLVIALLSSLAPAAALDLPNDLHWRLVGPHRGGWATAVAGIPGDPATFYLGAADGGVWRTDDVGTTWRPLFDDYGSASIGALAVAPSDPRVLWIGTGQVHQRWDIVDGDGIYRSTDGGETWSWVGLPESRHIGDLWVDPRSADTALVAALGPVFGPGGERGVFRTEDAGASWTRVLFLDDDTGAVSLAADAALPDVIYASLWQVRRWPWLDYFQPTIGPGSGIHRSTDGGRTWSAVAGDGLPAGPLGRIELAVAPGTEARQLWAAVETADGGGLWRSEDGGGSWRQVNPDASLAGSYMSFLVPHPSDPETLWAGGQPLRRSTDGGATFPIVRSSPGGDDYHALWIDPTDPSHMITGADQGAVVTLNGGATWSSWYNQPTGQFYRLAADDAFPYRVYSGQQDSGTVGIASRSDYGQITFRDWSPVGGDERDGDVPHPADPDIVFGAGLGGRISKWDRRTGQVQNVSPWPVSSYAARPGTTRYRYDWITPLAISKRPPHPIYVGAQVLFRSLDGGASWETISPDLTGTVEGTAGCEGDVPVERATACGFGVIFAIAPSTAADGQVWVGTTNGRVQLTRDGGTSWTDATPPDMDDWTKVNFVDPSPTDPATAYLSADRHRLDDRRPLAWKTRDFGATWSRIDAGLPTDEWVGVVRHDPEAPGLLFAGTNRGVHVSFDDGASWASLQLDLPTTGINDLLVHQDDVILATEGRGIWALDAIAPLRHLAAGPRLGGDPVLVPPAPAVRLRFNQNRDTPLPLEAPRGENPPVGAVLDYLLPDGIEGPVAIEIADSDGRVLRRFSSDEAPAEPEARVYFADVWLGEPSLPGTGPGHHRFVWDLRLAPPETLGGSYSIAAVPGRPTPVEPEGAFVTPGSYEVRLHAGGRVATEPLQVVMDPRVQVPAGALDELLSFQLEVAAALERAVTSVREDESEAVREAAGALTDLAADLERSDAPPTAPQRAVLSWSLGLLE